MVTEGNEDCDGTKALRLLCVLQKGQIEMHQSLKFLKNQISNTNASITRLVGDGDEDFLKLDVLIGCQTMCEWDNLCEQVNNFEMVSIHSYNRILTYCMK